VHPFPCIVLSVLHGGTFFFARRGQFYFITMDDSKKIVMVFGVFDGFHEGHQYFLRTARAHGDCLIVVVARDEYVKRVKKRVPKYDEEERMKTIQDSGVAERVYLADAEEGAWKIIKDIMPDSVAIGYDQQVLAESLKNALPIMKKPIHFVYIDSYKTDIYQSRILHKRHL
jgi:cytidyltransferase-like protein